MHEQGAHVPRLGRQTNAVDGKGDNLQLQDQSERDWLGDMVDQSNNFGAVVCVHCVLTSNVSALLEM